jgi:hypothetical protein
MNGLELACTSLASVSQEDHREKLGSLAPGAMDRAGVQSVLQQAGISDANMEGLDVGAEVFILACQVIDRLEQRQLQFVGSTAYVWERYEGSKEFLTS